jgi:hypothetical protein
MLYFWYFLLQGGRFMARAAGRRVPPSRKPSKVNAEPEVKARRQKKQKKGSNGHGKKK